ncbi:hypothetical protein [Roseateles sp.]|uniref:hypothetical protein n=1 Tax=Roseateles sp. TaxID=1971397 RepID=UPI002F41D14F
MRKPSTSAGPTVPATRTSAPELPPDVIHAAMRRGDVLHVPARRLVKPTTPRTVHLLNIPALAAPVQAEATTEADFVRLAALCPAVKQIVAQPCTLLFDGRAYTPDYRVECHGGAVSYWEVKLEKRFDDYRALFNQAAQYLHHRGERFYAISNVSLRFRGQHLHAELLHRYGKAAPPEDDVSRVLAEVRAHPHGYSAVRLAARARAPLELIYHLLARRRLTFKRRIGEADLITLPEFLEKQDDLLLASWLDVSPWRTNAGIDARATGRQARP